MPCASKVNAYYSHYNKSKIRRRCNEELRFVPYMVYKSGPAEIRNSQINFIVKRNELQSIRSSYSWLFSEVLLSPVKTGQQPDGGHPRTADTATNTLSMELLKKKTSTFEGYDNTNRTNIRDILYRLRVRRSQPCLERVHYKFNRCLGRYQSEVSCKSSHIGCALHRVPPKCKRNYSVMFGKNNASCLVATSCSCA
ncbi:unnamed protein product [Porites lobata]|uniref:Uncharacterized protein n=1 Tax=Porites lobata TaxID=104759 RepID=A0ABN8PMU6_9CNID|nr:unnamed protein product [Porites lobata]